MQSIHLIEIIRMQKRIMKNQFFFFWICLMSKLLESKTKILTQSDLQKKKRVCFVKLLLALISPLINGIN